jgi:hypothetical protein
LTTTCNGLVDAVASRSAQLVRRQPRQGAHDPIFRYLSVPQCTTVSGAHGESVGCRTNTHARGVTRNCHSKTNVYRFSSPEKRIQLPMKALPPGSRPRRVARSARILNFRKLASFITFAVFTCVASFAVSGVSQRDESSDVRRLEENLGLVPLTLDASAVRDFVSVIPARAQRRPHALTPDRPFAPLRRLPSRKPCSATLPRPMMHRVRHSATWERPFFFGSC